MAAPLWMPLYVADYITDTRHLSTIEHGAYLLLLMQAWTDGGKLPADPERLRRIAGLQPKEWKAAWPVLREFFSESDEGFRHKRIDRELSAAATISAKRKAAADARWGQSNSNANASAIGDANALQTECQPQPQPQPQVEEGEEELGKEPLLHRELAFSGRVIRLNRRDLAEWERRYSAIPDLSAELGALDDWLRGQDSKTCKNWFHVVSGALAKKHQKALAEARKADDDEWEMPIC